MEKEIAIAGQNPDNCPLYGFKMFGITETDISLGLRHVKQKTRRQFKVLVKKWHPDTKYFKGNIYKNKRLHSAPYVVKTNSKRKSFWSEEGAQEYYEKTREVKSRNDKGYNFAKLCKMRDRIEGLTIMPITIDTIEIIAEINKGYLSSEDVVFPWD